MDIAIAVFTATSSEVIAQGNLHDFRSELNQIYWRICCANREDVIKSNETYKNYSWIRDKNYKDSRSKVIGEAIGDCVAGKNEFAGKTAEDIITFEGTSPENYEQKHWNAVILYNYFNAVVDSSKINPDQIGNREYPEWTSNVQSGLNSKVHDIYKRYENDYNSNKKLLCQNLKQAIKNIQQYVNALDLCEVLCEFNVSKKKYDEDARIDVIAPFVNLNIDSNNERIFFSERMAFWKTLVNCDPTQRVGYTPELQISQW